MFFPKNEENVPKIGAETGFFEFITKSGYLLFVNLAVDESLYYMLCFCTKTISGKNLDPKIWAKMLLASQIVGFLNQLYMFRTNG